MMSGFVFTTSWDDGHPLDRRLADLLDKYGLNGTFFVPRRNVEGRPVIESQLLAELAARFEVGGHTLDHKILVTLSEREQKYQISEGKKWQEDVIGKETTGFCYPQGKQNAAIRGLVKNAGYRYARTVENLSIGCGTDRYRMPTTLQIYPHTRNVYFRNLSSYPWAVSKIGALGTVLTSRDLNGRLMSMLRYTQKHGGMFHLWGHSWEIDETDAWQCLEDFFSFVSDRVPIHQRMNNRQVATKLYSFS